MGGWEDSSRASNQPIDSAETISVSESCETSNDPQVFISPPAHVQDGTGLERSYPADAEGSRFLGVRTATAVMMSSTLFQFDSDFRSHTGKI